MQKEYASPFAHLIHGTSQRAALLRAFLAGSAEKIQLCGAEYAYLLPELGYWSKVADEELRGESKLPF